MRFSTILVGIAATTIAAKGNALSTEAELKAIAKFETPELVRAVDGPKRSLRSNKFVELDDDDDNLEEERGSLRFSKSTFNGWLDDTKLADEKLKELIELQYNVKSVGKLLKTKKNPKYNKLLRRFESLLKESQGRKP